MEYNDGTFHIEIALGNAAMLTTADIAHALMVTAERIDATARPYVTGVISDANGNCVGAYWTEES